MMRDHFRVLVVDAATGRAKVETFDGLDDLGGGSGLGAMLFQKYADPTGAWDDPAQPLIFTVGPLTGLYPLMSKTVCTFVSPYHGQFAESHAGGRSALCLAMAGYDGLVILGRAPYLSSLCVGSRRVDLGDVRHFKGFDALSVGKALRKSYPDSGHRSILRIGPAGENGSAMACITVDTYRHFGRLGAGAAMGAKNLKAIALLGDGNHPAPAGKEYPKLFQAVFDSVTDTDMMRKYHDLGTAANIKKLNTDKFLPWRNLQATTDPDVDGITGERFGDEALLRNMACAGCPVGCIHIGFVRERFQAGHRYLYRQVAYDYEPIFAMGSMCGVTDAFEVLKLLDVVEKVGLDVMGTGVALAWVIEALEKGVVSQQETGIPLDFGDVPGLSLAVRHMGEGTNEFWRTLANGLPSAVARYGGEDFACVLGQEMAGYATGEVFFTAQALGLRHSHLDTGGYSYDQKNDVQDVTKAVDFLVSDEAGRVVLMSMVACLFARSVYTQERLAECLEAVGYGGLAANLGQVGVNGQRLRWRMRLAMGYDPASVKIPKRFLEVVTRKGGVDPVYLEALKASYADRIAHLGAPVDE